MPSDVLQRDAEVAGAHPAGHLPADLGAAALVRGCAVGTGDRRPRRQGSPWTEARTTELERLTQDPEVADAGTSSPYARGAARGNGAVALDDVELLRVLHHLEADDAVTRTWPVRGQHTQAQKQEQMARAMSGTAVRLFLDTWTPVSPGTGEQRGTSDMSHRRDSLSSPCSAVPGAALTAWSRSGGRLSLDVRPVSVAGSTTRRGRRAWDIRLVDMGEPAIQTRTRPSNHRRGDRTMTGHGELFAGAPSRLHRTWTAC